MEFCITTRDDWSNLSYAMTAFRRLGKSFATVIKANASLKELKMGEWFDKPAVFELLYAYLFSMSHTIDKALYKRQYDGVKTIWNLCLMMIFYPECKNLYPMCLPADECDLSVTQALVQVQMAYNAFRGSGATLNKTTPTFYVCVLILCLQSRM